ncbi:ABC transporter permease [Ruminiclostridium cellobioparum]|uniref:ABC transporter permease n=1 Tax=Ruminiclostridium cellobioparum TaxID=29355 RepID=UPI000484A25F|nr:ABC transporter permease [Ruminiclostridium cellobioparum]
MKILWSAYYEFLKQIRDIRILIALIVFPISIIVLLGTAFDNKLTEDFKEKVKTGYIILDKGQVGKGLEQMLETDEIKKIIRTESYVNEMDAISAMKTGKIDNYFVVEENSTKAIMNGKPAAIRLEGRKNIELVQTVLNSYISKSNAIAVASGISGDRIKLEDHSGNPNYFERMVPAAAKLPRAIDYYSVLTLLMVVSEGAILGIFIVSKNPESNIQIRLYSLPTSQWTIICGNILGSSMFLFLSCIVTVIFTKFVYGANWDGNIALIGVALLIFSFLCIGMGVMLHLFISSLASAMGLALLLTVVMSNAGGGITPATALQSLNIVNPIYYAKVFIFGILYNYPDRVLLRSAAGLLAVTAAVYAAAFLKLRRVNYDNI